MRYGNNICERRDREEDKVINMVQISIKYDQWRQEEAQNKKQTPPAPKPTPLHVILEENFNMYDVPNNKTFFDMKMGLKFAKELIFQIQQKPEYAGFYMKPTQLLNTTKGRLKEKMAAVAQENFRPRSQILVKTIEVSIHNQY